MIMATSPIFTTIFGRIFLKEAIVIADIINLFLVFAGIVFIVKPPFMFGHSNLYIEDPEALYAIIALVISSASLWALVFVILRQLKGTILHFLLF